MQASFTIDSSGQIKVGASPTLDYESVKKSYSVTVEVRDRPTDTNPDATIGVTITVTDVNEKPAFTDGPPATRSIAENSATDANIGPPVAATDPDTGDTLTYTLGGTDSAFLQYRWNVWAVEDQGRVEQRGEGQLHGHRVGA